MRTVFKILLTPVWLLLAVLKLAFRLATGTASFALTIGGGLLIAVPLIAGIMTSLLETAQEPIKEFI